nr:hypothetical protein [Pseudodesulfovibrio sp.]
MTQKLKVALYGAGSGGELMERNLRGSECVVVVFFDSDLSKMGSCLSGIPIDIPANHARYEYDFIIIASTTVYEESICNTLKKLQIPSEIIVPRTLLTNNLPLIIRNYRNGSCPDVCASGMSYHRQAIIPQYSSHSIFNYAQTSMDIFYDFSVAKEFLHGCATTPKVWLIGLTYYSLHYDMSLSQPWTRVFYYKDLFGYHNLSEKRKAYYLNEFDMKKLTEMLPESIVKSVQAAEYTTQVLENRHEVDRKVMAELSQKQAKTDSNKDYPATVDENKRLLEAYVQLLVEKGIQPVFTLIPFPAAYPIGEKLFAEFFEYLKSLEIKYGCQIINGYDLNGYGDECFYDVSHLNLQGGIKFTQHVDEFLKKIIS